MSKKSERKPLLYWRIERLFSFLFRNRHAANDVFLANESIARQKYLLDYFHNYNEERKKSIEEKEVLIEKYSLLIALASHSWEKEEIADMPQQSEEAGKSKEEHEEE